MNCFEEFPKEGFGFVYKYKSPSGKEYVGQTINSLKIRSAKGRGYKRNPIFYAAIQKYGFENFEWEILEECPIGELDQKEEYYIKKFGTLCPNGYNVFKESPDNGLAAKNEKSPISPTGRKTAQLDLQGNLIQVFTSANEASRSIGKNTAAGRNIRSVCDGKRTSAYGYKWEYLE